LAQRLDKWLVYARFVKHRSTAASLIENGGVRVNRVRVAKPSQAVKLEDVITIAVAGKVKVVRVLGEAERRGSASVASQLYQELAPLEL
jgi:ribosome-associated heat shock protein Hsp15